MMKSGAGCLQGIGAKAKNRREIYQCLRDYLRSSQLPSGTQIPPARQLAKQFGISYVTMHSALDDLVREGLLIRHQGKGTFVASVAAKKKRPQTTQLAMLLPPEEEIQASGTADVVLSLIRGSSAGAAACAAQLAVVTIPSNLQAANLEELCRMATGSDGVLFVGDQFVSLIEKVRDKPHPFVMLACDSALGSTVNYDQQRGVHLATEHLLGHGYRRIGFLGTTEGLYSDKFGFFQRVLADGGATLDPAQVQPCALIQEAHRAARKFLEQSALPEAVFVDNYYKAEALVQWAHARELRVPDDLAVMAYGTEHAGGIQPPLSMLKVPAEEIGRLAALTLDQLIRGKVLPPVRKIVQPSLVIRGSCGCAFDQPNAVSEASLQEGVLA